MRFQGLALPVSGFADWCNQSLGGLRGLVLQVCGLHLSVGALPGF